MEIQESILLNVHKPFDLVESEKGSIGYIREVSINTTKGDSVESQVTYSVNWIKNIGQEHNAWWTHGELTVLGNIFKEIAMSAVHPFSTNGKEIVDRLM